MPDTRQTPHTPTPCRRNWLGPALVLIYFGACVMSVVHAASIDDPKGQAVWLQAPLWLTPGPLLELLPSLPWPNSYDTWRLNTLLRYPAAIAFTATALFLVGSVLGHLGSRSARLGAGVGAILGLGAAALGFFITHGGSYAWFALSAIGALAGVLVHHQRSSP